MRTRTVGLVVAGAGLAIVAAVFREAAVALVYGTGPAADAIVVASAVPVFLQVTLVSGIINANGVKMLVDARKDGSTLVVGVALGVAGAAILIPILLLAILAPETLVKILAPTISGAALAGAVGLIPLMSLATIVLYTAAIYVAILNVRNLAPLASTAQAIPGFTVAATLAVSRPSRPTGYGAGFMLGASGLLAVLYLRTRSYDKVAMDFKQPFRWAQVGRAITRLAPASSLLFGGAILGQLAATVERSIALRAGVGNLAAIAYSTRITNVPVSLAASVIGALLLVRLARLRGDPAYHRLLRVARIALAFAVSGAAALVYINAHLLIRLLLHRGAFNADSVVRTEHFTQLFALAIPVQVLSGLMAFAVYAQGRPSAAAAAGVLTSLLNVVLLLLLAGVLGASAVPVAVTITSLVSFLILGHLIAPFRFTWAGGIAVLGCGLCGMTAVLFTGPLASSMGTSYLRLVASTAVITALAIAVWYGSPQVLRDDLVGFLGGRRRRSIGAV